MDGTRTARMAALAAATVVGLTLVAAAVLTTGQRAVSERAPGFAGAASDIGAPAAPRTTPPPTFPASGGVDITGRPAGTLAATTVEHS